MLLIRRALTIAVVLVAGLATQAKADAQCTIFTKSDAERVLHAPVVAVESPDKTDCSWGLAKDSSVGVLVSRGSRSDWYPPHPGTTGVSQLRHIGGVGENAYTYYASAGAGGVYTAEVLTSKGVTSVTVAEKAGNAATALAIAKMVMNR